ncbi:MAG: substrate-binding domain-containing protein [Deltaproteobacteria bacterium]|nr:substrate-binding domain-containing protein [Deltaproteobacteria bacterium]
MRNNGMVSVALVGLSLGIALSIAWAVERGETPPNSQANHAPRPAVSDRDVLQIAGSGSNLPLTQRLLRVWQAQSHVAAVLHPSIGTTGALRALSDHAIHLGLISRELNRGETEGGALTLEPYARSIVVFAAHPDTRDEAWTSGDVRATLSGHDTHWSDGSPRVWLMREVGDSSHLAAARGIAEFAAIEQQAYRVGRFRVLYSDAELRTALIATAGAVGLTDLGSIQIERLGLRPLALDGVEPTVANVRAGRYPLHKPLFFVLPRTVDPRVRQFVNFVHSLEGHRIIEENGYVPMDSVP